MRDPKTCEHWEMMFFVASTDTIFVRCMACNTQAAVKPDGGSVFTTNRAKMELNKKRDGQVQTGLSHEELGNRLRNARERAGIKQYEAAALINLDATAISKIEHGDRIINALELGRLATFYQVAVGDLLKSAEETE